MNLLPYPPEWSRETSPEILTFWERFARHTWIRFYLVWRDEEKQMAWRITAFTGLMALILVLLLFLESFPTIRRPIRKIVRHINPSSRMVVPEVTTLTELSPPLVEVSYAVEFGVIEPAGFSWQVNVPVPESVVETTPVVPPPQDPKPALVNFDPFEAFAPAPSTPMVEVKEPQPMIPREIFPQEMPIVRQLPELTVDLANTDLYPNDQFFERMVSFREESRFYGSQSSVSLARTPWKRSSLDDSRHFADPIRPSMLEKNNVWLTSLELPPKSNDRPDEAGEKRSQIHGDLELTKIAPSGVSKHQLFTYTIKLKNRGKKTIDYAKVIEETSELVSIQQVSPTASFDNSQLEWVITSLSPGETRELKITCQALDREAALKLQSSVDILHTLASSTQVIVPDVVVEVTLPVKVSSGKDFPVQILVSNNSQKTFAPSDLRIKFLKGVHRVGETDITTKIDVPAPGKSLSIPMTVTPKETGEAILEASLNLEKTLTVPVTAYTVVATEEGSEEKKTQESPASEVQEAESRKRENGLAINSL